MTAWLDSLAIWHWWLFAGFLIMIEFLWPVYLFLWLGIAAAAVGVFLVVFPDLAVSVQLILFLILALAALVARYLQRGKSLPSMEKWSSGRGSSDYIGCEFTLEEPIDSGLGRICVGDTSWPVAGPDLPAGTRVRVTRREGLRFRVEPVIR